MSGITIEKIQHVLLGAALLGALGFALFEKIERPRAVAMVERPLALPKQHAVDAQIQQVRVCKDDRGACGQRMERDRLIASRH